MPKGRLLLILFRILKSLGYLVFKLRLSCFTVGYLVFLNLNAFELVLIITKYYFVVVKIYVQILRNLEFTHLNYG